MVDRPEHRALAEEIAARAVTLVREAPGALPLAASQRVVHLVVNDIASVAQPGRELAAELKRRFGRAPQTFVFDPRSRAEEVEPLLAAAAGTDAVLVSLFVRVRTGSGKLVLPEAARGAIERLSSSGARLVGVSFGNPYVAADLPGLATYVAAYGDQPVMQVAVARAIFGETPITGRLPVTIPGVAGRGAGISRDRKR